MPNCKRSNDDCSETRECECGCQSGRDGRDGRDGRKGKDGHQGPKGCKGETGSTGPVGADGSTGPMGQTGAQGLQGVTGSQGAQGVQGLQGDTGAQGLQGDTGAQGLQGDTGAQGLQGDTGAQGLQGDTGAQGLQGDTGAQGLQGDTGAQGLQGLQGLEGATGPMGQTGSQGLQGATGPMGDTGAQGLHGVTGIQGQTGATGLIFPISHYLRVDSVFGNDVNGAADPTRIPFLTIGAALASAVSGDEVFVYPGHYNEAVTVPEGVSLRGADMLNTVIQQVNPSSATVVVRLNPNSYISDFTVSLSLSSAPDAGPYVGVEFLTGSASNAKVRACVITMILSSGSAAIYGVLSSGVGFLPPLVSHTVKSTQVQVSASGSLPARAVLLNGEHRVVISDSTLFCNLGSGTDLVGAEVTNLSAILAIRTGTVNGKTADLLQTSGSIIIGAVALFSHLAPLSFTCDVNPSAIYFGILGFPGGDLTYYLPPGMIPIASVSTVDPYVFRFINPLIVIGLSITYNGIIGLTDTVTFGLYKNNAATGITVTLTNVSPQTVEILSLGVTFFNTDTIDMRLTTVGSPNTGSFTGKILTY